MAALTKADLQAHISVAQSFGQDADLKRLGVAVSDATCGKCGHQGKVMGGKGDPVVAHGFELLTKGGLKAVLLQCEKCGERLSVDL